MPVDLRAIDADFYAWTGHKALGPTVGLLHGRRELLKEMRPFLGGGHMISRVEREHSTWNELPWKFEAGTNAIAEAIGLGAAIDYLAAIGMENVRAHERELTAYALERLPEVDGLTLYGPPEHRPARRRGAVHDRGDAPARHRRAVRPRGGLRPRRPPLRPAADARARRAAPRRAPRSTSTTRARTWTGWCTRCTAPARSSGWALMDALYRDYILDHYKNPRNFGSSSPHDLEFHDHNPLCGDELGVHIVVEDGKVADLRFHGQGCAISQAAASITSEELIGMPSTRWPASRPTG